MKRWNGDIPEECQICCAIITTEFVDGRIILGSWANMCRSCHKSKGVGLGTGRGQLYKKNAEGTFTKVEG